MKSINERTAADAVDHLPDHLKPDDVEVHPDGFALIYQGGEHQ